MNIKFDFRFDFIIHWLFAIVFIVLTLTGLAMAGTKYGWILGYDIAMADYLHRIFAMVYVVLAFISVSYEIVRTVKHGHKKLTWFIIGKSGYQLFTFITTLIFIISGAIIWVMMDAEMPVVAFALFVHEKLTYVVLISLIWHIYDKAKIMHMQKKEEEAEKTAKKM